MSTHRCPNCDTPLRLDGVSPGASYDCPRCGAPCHAPPAGDIIDVHAEPLDPHDPPVGARDEPSTSQALDIGGLRHDAQDDTPYTAQNIGDAPGRGRAFTFEYSRRHGSNPGCCCGAGCFLILVFILLAFQGFLSLFS